MSRNIGRTKCYFCQGAITLDELRRPIIEEDAGYYFPEYRGMLVANASCAVCEAKYLAWIDDTVRERFVGCNTDFFDLSFRSTFNDEPGHDDMPAYEIEKIVTYKKTPWPTFACGARILQRGYDWCQKCKKSHKDKAVAK